MKADKLIILDRDGTINIDKHYLSDPDELELLPGAVEGLQILAEAGFRFAIATNQSAIGRGYFDVKRLSEINQRLLAMLATFNIRIETLEYCPHIPQDQCKCRKPEPGMAYKIADDLGISLKESFVVVIGDREGDIGLANNIGSRSILLSGNPDQSPEFGQSASAISIMDAASIIKKWL